MPLRIVHLEDDPLDRELVAQALHGDTIDCLIVPAATREAFEDALVDRPDVILSDMSLPGLDGISAQQLALGRWPQVPFLYVSGSMGEEAAIERLKAGATDYVLKHRLEKLAMAVRRAVREADDRSHRVNAEQALRQLNAQLEVRVTERTEALTRANLALVRARLEADRANHAKSDFLSRMSHDLRTPLNAIIGFAQLIEMDNPPADQREGVGHILRAGRHLLDMINEVLDISRIEAGRLSLSPEPVDLDGLLADAVELLRPLAAQRGLAISITVPPNTYVMADRMRLNQVFFNVLSNAVKYNRDGGMVDISITVGDRLTTINVVDTGAGMSDRQLERLFTPFERLGAERSGVEGTGLGLALVKGLIEAMSGTIHVESVVEQGSCFAVTLPTCAPPAAGADIDPSEEHQARHDSAVHGTVLYIEDNASNVRLMEAVLSKRPGVTMLQAADGERGLEMLHERRPDLVFLDLHLPRVTGQEVLRRIWQDPATRGIPVVVLTADATPAQTRRLLAAGATAYLTKPVDIREVLAVLDVVLKPSGHEFPQP